MKKVLLFSFLALAIVFTTKAMYSSTEVVEESGWLSETPEGDMACNWCINSNTGTYCATAQTCKKAKQIARQMAQE